MGQRGPGSTIPGPDGGTVLALHLEGSPDSQGSPHPERPRGEAVATLGWRGRLLLTSLSRELPGHGLEQLEEILGEVEQVLAAGVDFVGKHHLLGDELLQIV